MNAQVIFKQCSPGKHPQGFKGFNFSGINFKLVL